MLNYINNLKPFIEDTTRQINVREYAKLAKVSPPTASKLLKQFEKEGLLLKEETMQRHLYRAAKTDLFKDLARIYWKEKLSGLLDHLEKEALFPVIILFGSLANAENSAKSDVDIAVFTPKKIKPSLSQFEREIHLFVFEKPSDAGEDLATSIINGVILRGVWRHGLDAMPNRRHSKEGKTK